MPFTTYKRSRDGAVLLPVERILWAPTNSAHHNHLHVVGQPREDGYPPHSHPGTTDSLAEIIAALDEEFGEGGHWQTWDDTLGWTHMGIYNRRYIGGTTVWSQHAYANAIDIGPYYGIEQQQKFYDFLTRKEEDELSKETVWEALREGRIGSDANDPSILLAIARTYRMVNALYVDEIVNDSPIDLSDEDIAALAVKIKDGLGDEVATSIGQKLVQGS